MVSRKPPSESKTRLEADVILEEVSFVLTQSDDTLTADLHAEVETKGTLSPMRMFEYDYEIARKNAKSGEALKFPVSYAVLLRTPPRGKKAVWFDGIRAVDAFGRTCCSYVYNVRYLSEDALGTLIGPVVAASLDVEAEEKVELILGAMLAAIDGLPDGPISDSYWTHMVQGLDQKFGGLLSELQDRDPTDHTTARAREALESIQRGEGGHTMRNIFREMLDEREAKGRAEGEANALATIVENMVHTLGLSPEDAERAAKGLPVKGSGDLPLLKLPTK